MCIQEDLAYGSMSMTKVLSVVIFFSFVLN